MKTSQFLDDLQSKINKVIEHSPIKDLEKNIKSILYQGLYKLDLITREELNTKIQILKNMQTKLEELEKRISILETHQKN